MPEALSWDAVYALLQLAPLERVQCGDAIRAMVADVRSELVAHGAIENLGPGSSDPKNPGADRWQLTPVAADIVQAYVYAAKQVDLMKRQPPDPNDRGPCPTCRRIPVSGKTWSKLTAYDAKVKKLQDENAELRKRLESK